MTRERGAENSGRGFALSKLNLGVPIYNLGKHRHQFSTSLAAFEKKLITILNASAKTFDSLFEILIRSGQCGFVDSSRGVSAN